VSARRRDHALHSSRVARTVAGTLTAAVGVGVFVLALLRGQAEYASAIPLVLVGFGLGMAQPELMTRTIKLVLRISDPPPRDDP
jgi:hypothetical protein